MKFFYQLNFFLILTIIFFVSACSDSSTPKNILTVQSHSFVNTLYYSGAVQPLKTIVVPSPADGAVVEMPFQYGEEVKAGQLLFMLSSAKFLTDYKSALMQYIKAKSEFNNSQTQLSEADFLHKNQLISDDEYKLKKSNFYGNQLALLQAKDALNSLLTQLDIKNINLYTLSIAEVDKITEALHLQMSSEHLRVIAPAAGIVLSANKNEDESKKVMKGDTVKQGDVLAVIGDMSGISVRVKVNELIINQLKVGQKVKITGIAFPEQELIGEIKRVERQAEATNSGAPTFAVEVIVPKLTLDAQKEIHVGMSAKVEIAIEESPQIMIPMTAIKEKNGVAYAEVYDAYLNKTHEVALNTGKTTTDSVVILSGLKVGDKIKV